MTLRTILIVALALVFGGSAALGIHALRKAPAAQATDRVPVVVAAADIPRFTMITADLVKTRAFPKELVPPGALTQVEDAVGRVPFIALVKDEVVLDTKLAARGAGRGMAAVIPEGMRAFTIQTATVAAGVAGFILPGNKVDVLLTVNYQGQNHPSGGASTTTLLQGVEILAVDQRVEAPAENKVDVKELRSVTLLVTPDQAARLDLGQNKGTLHLSLRNPNDQQPADARRATLADLGFYQEKPKEEPKQAPVVAPAPPAPPPPPPRTWIRTLRGNHEGAVELKPAGAVSQ